MPVNHVKQTLKAGGWVSGPIIEEIRSVGQVKMLALAGHDFLWFDTEHNMYDYETLHTLVQYSFACGITPLVRVTDLSYTAVARALDSGAHGVIIPRVDDREQVEQAVSYAKYPPEGRRGAGGLARNAYDPMETKEAVEYGNRETMVVVQIESPEAVERIDEIASVPGLDVVSIGPQDLSINMGVHGKVDDPDFVDAVRKVAESADRHGIASGMVSRDAAQFAVWHELGCRFLVCNSDLALLQQAAARDVETLKQITGA